jgi:predicted ester cyclase
MTSAISSDPQVEANKAAVRHMLARISAGDVEGFTAVLSPDYVRHCQAMPENLQVIRGKEEMHEWLLSNKATFPDYHEELEWLVGEGDFVAWRSIGTGTQSGALGPFPATHKRMQIVIIGMHRFQEGKVIETWTVWDNLAALSQLGLLGTTP